MNNILRWLCVLPAAILACFITYVIFVFGNYLFTKVDSFLYGLPLLDEIITFINRIIFVGLQILGNGVAAGMFIVAGASVAPTLKTPTAIVLCVIGCLALVIAICFISIERTWVDYAGYIAAFIGNVTGLLSVYEQYKKSPK